MLSPHGTFEALGAVPDYGFYLFIHFGPIVELFKDFFDFRITKVQNFLMCGYDKALLVCEGLYDFGIGVGQT